MKIETALGRNVRRLRLEAGLSQEVLSREVGVATRHIGSIERGDTSATIGLLARIAQALGCQVTDLIGEHHGPMPPNLPRGRSASGSDVPSGKSRSRSPIVANPKARDHRPNNPTVTRAATHAAGEIRKTDLEILHKILWRRDEGTFSEAAERMVDELIDTVGGEENLTLVQRKNIDLARAWAAARDAELVSDR